MTKTQIKFGTYPTFYGKDNVTFAFENGELGFELEVGNETYRHRTILTLENALELKKKIENSLDAYDTFMKSYGKQKDT